MCVTTIINIYLNIREEKKNTVDDSRNWFINELEDTIYLQNKSKSS